MAESLSLRNIFSEPLPFFGETPLSPVKAGYYEPSQGGVPMQSRMSELCPRRRAGMWLRMVAVAGFSVLTVAVTAPRAHAICGQLDGARTSVIKVPMMPAAADDFGQHHYDTFVGLWQTAYSTGGVVFAETFKQWHADGTEIDNKDQNPTLGSVCLGVWKPVGARGVRLHHVPRKSWRKATTK